MFFSRLDSGDWFGGRKTTEVSFLSCHIMGIYYQQELIPVEIDLDHVAEVMLVRFLHWDVAPPLSLLFERKSLYVAHA